MSKKERPYLYFHLFANSVENKKEIPYYFIRLYYVGVNSVDESIRRIKNRVEKGGHYIPEQDVTRRYNKRFADLAKEIWIKVSCNEKRTRFK